MSEENARELLQEVTDLLMEKGCTVSKPAMLDLAIYILERERKAVASLEIIPLTKDEEVYKRGEE